MTHDAQNLPYHERCYPGCGHRQVREFGPCTSALIARGKTLPHDNTYGLACDPDECVRCLAEAADAE